MKQKILVLGCNGMAGFVISKNLLDYGFDVYGLARSKSSIIPTIIQDVTDFKELSKTIVNGNFNYIINCIGILNKDANDNPEKAILLNSYLPHFLVKLTRSLDCKIIHMSTDCVFSGSKGAYTETDFPDGETFYDRSKALGEIIDSKNLTLRGSIIGPDLKESGIGLFNWFMKQSQSINGFTKAIWSGVTTVELSKIIISSIEQNVVGLMHIVPEKSISKFHLLELLNSNFKGGCIAIKEDSSLVIDKSLQRTNFELDYKVPGYKEMIEDLYDWILVNKSYFPHYRLN